MTAKQEAKTKEKIIGVEEVKAACGHLVKLELHEKERFLEKRRQNASARACPSCRQEAHQKLTQEQQAAKAARPPKQSRYMPKDLKGSRLPDGSMFNVIYHATEEKWEGILTIPDVGKFEGKESAVFYLLRQLDLQYREASQSAQRKETGA